MNFLGGLGHGPGTNEFNFGDDPDQRPDPGVRSPKSGFTGLSTMLAFGGGLRSLSTSSFSVIVIVVLGVFKTKFVSASHTLHTNCTSIIAY